jgi:hypothetical protein
LEGAANVQWTQGTPISVKVDGPEKLVAITTTDVKDDTLVICQKPNYNINGKLTVTVVAPAAHTFELIGAGNIRATGLVGDKLVLRLAGAGNATLKGQAKSVECRLTGAGNIDAKDLKAESVTVDVSGVGNADVYASEELTATVSGVGHVGYYGHPKKISKSASGVGGVTERENGAG